MSWSMLYNGNCPPPGPEQFRFVQVASGQTNQAAIDNRGRLYTWGSASWGYTGQTPVPVEGTPNFLPHTAINTNFEMTYPYQVGTKSDWVKVEIAEYNLMAIDKSGHLYAWGEDHYGGSGWEINSQYTYTGPPYSYKPGGNEALVPTLVNNEVWKDFSLGWYHTIGLKHDGSLWIWGSNTYPGPYTYGNPAVYGDEFKSLIPIEMTWVPGPVKLICADYAVTAIVTVDDQVWIWGDFSRDELLDYNTPTHIPLSLPAGITITQIACSWTGVVVLLSNGKVYCQGDEINFDATGGTVSKDFVPDPDNHTFKAIDCFGQKAAGIDVNGNAWAWGYMIYLINAPSTDIPPDDCEYNHFYSRPTLALADSLGQYNWNTISLGGWTYVGITEHGDLRTQGENAYAELGVGLRESEFDHACLPVQPLPALLDDGSVASEQVSVGTAAILVQVHTPLPQLAAHNPCGHWHKGLDSAIQGGEYPENCWEPTIATDGIRALYVICGRHRPNEMIMLNYQIAQNTWSTLLHRQDVLHSNWDGGAALAGDVSAFHNYAYDITGEQYQEVTSNPRMRTYVVNGSTVNVTNWTGTSELNGRNKIAVTATGAVACIVRSSSTWQIHGSSNSGATYSLLYTLPGTVTDAAILFDPQDGLIYVAVTDSAADELRIYSGTIAGAGWTLKSTTAIVDAPQRLRFHVDEDRYFVIAQGSNTRFYYSTDNCSSFLARDLQEPSVHFAATGTNLYNLGDQRDYYTDDYEQVVIVWHEAAPINTPVERCTLHNLGNTAVFSQATLRDDSGNIVTLLISFNLGREWKEISTPLNYYETFEETLSHGDDPVWAFTPQWEKI